MQYTTTPVAASETAPENRPAVSVIIANLNGRHFLERCLTSVLAQDYRPFQVTLIDNGSVDGSAAWVGEHFPQVTLIRNPCNLGFAAANNQGIESTTAPYLVTLNNDTQVAEGWLTALVAAAESAPDVGMCACRILLDGRPSIVDSAGIKLDWTGIARNRGWGEPDADWREPGTVWGASAAAALYRRAMIEEVGLFDPAFVAYYEDVDLAWRAHRAGWRCLYVPEACVHHVHSGTLGAHSPVKQYLLSRNKIWTILKNYPAPAFLAALPLLLVADQLALAYRIVRSPTLGWSALRGRLAAWRSLPALLRQRQCVQRQQAALRDTGSAYHLRAAKDAKSLVSSLAPINVISR